MWDMGCGGTQVTAGAEVGNGSQSDSPVTKVVAVVLPKALGDCCFCFFSPKVLVSAFIILF